MICENCKKERTEFNYVENVCDKCCQTDKW